MEYVTSDDGTQIAFRRAGDGPALVLVHGTGVDRHVWDDVVPALSERFTVYAVNRRGRGESGDADEYSIAREFDDIEALADSIDGAVNLLAHSYGAICAVGAAPRLSGLRRLILYEPPLWRGESPSTPSAELERLEEMAERGENEKVLEAYYTDILDKPDRLASLRAKPSYEQRVGAAATLPREMSGRREFRPTPESYPEVDAPTMLLTGTKTGSPIKDSVEVTGELFPNSTTVTLEGQGHSAMNTAPEQFVATVREFLTVEERPSSEPQ